MTNLLYKYSKRTRGWRVKFLMGKDDKPIEGKVMIINGMGAEYLIEVEKDTPEDMVGHHLEDLVTKFLKDVEEKDIMYVSRETLMFMVFAQVIRAQSQCFVSYLTKDKKHDLQMFNNHVDKMVRSLESNYTELIGGDQIEKFSEVMGDVVFDVFLKFKEMAEVGKLDEFRNYVTAFNTEPSVVKMKATNEMKPIKVKKK